MVTASQLIRNAALKTGQLTLREKVINYADPSLEEVPDKVCWLCGGETAGRGVPTRKAIKPTFTDHPHARNQGSRSICSGCAFCLSARELRNYSILVTGDRLCHPTRAEWREVLTNPPEPPFVMCLAVSGQKHLTFKAPVNLERERFTVLLEERPIYVIPARFGSLIEVVEALYIYFSKDEISSGSYRQHKIKECSLRRWEELEMDIADWRGRPLFDLAIFVAQKEEVAEDEPAPAAITGRAAEDTGLTGQLVINGL